MDISCEDVIRRVNSHLIHHLRFESRHSVRRLPIEELLSPFRIDVIAKYIYAKHRKRGYDLTWSTELYREHLDVWGGFKEGDGAGKNSFEDYLNGFNSLLESIEKNGFDELESLLPIGNHGVIIDGAHRAAACLAYQVDPVAVLFDHNEARYTPEYFLNLGLPKKFLEAMVIEYARLKSNSYMVCLFPIAISRIDQVRCLLQTQGKIVYEKQIQYFNFGPVNLIAQLYKGEFWLGERRNGWPGAASHVTNKFVADVPVTFFLYECNSDPLVIRELKEEIRALYSLGNNSVHINDTHEETVRIAQQVFNSNSVHLMNEGDLSHNYRVHKLHQTFVEEAEINGYDLEEFCIDGSSVMALYGLRDSADLDFLTATDREERFSNELIHCHNDQLLYYTDPLGRLIFDPECFLYYDGVKYLALETLERMKRNRDEDKDRDDLQLISMVGKPQKNAFRQLRGARSINQRFRRLIKTFIPKSLLPMARWALRAIKNFRNILCYWFELFRIGDLTINYQGFNLYYSAGTSLIDRVRFGQIYEPDVTTAIVRALQKIKDPVVVDVGANIGLITLNILKYYPSAHIYAFEPGCHQRDLLVKTIQANDLSGQVVVSDIALSNENGVAEFAVHVSQHASGDGFMDTGRAGKSKKIIVQTECFDDWWIRNNRPAVNLIKLDTEGAELLILKGAKQFISIVKPIIIFEMFEKNMAPYNYSERELINVFSELNYMVKTMSGELITSSNVKGFMPLFETFIAYPIADN